MARRGRSSSTTRSPSRTQTRTASTASMAAPRPMAPAARPAAPTPTAAAPQQPGLFAQMASTAAGVAVGSTVGHVLGAGITSMFSGSDEPQQTHAQASYQPAQEQHGSASCSADAKAFTNCLEQSNNDVTACQFYYDMLKQCQSFSAQRF
ncbi:hypothetical protein DSO57_1035133 [Entomophthora muscae]|uniref:Uncharacterized protein n=1 Tax=Entomophthora muscae TaxID=34485 RepID=A0ACC2REG1_9FUNG|nr:hypothetical protein DSO57_1035133 [Entomophthora muscae]